MNKFLTIAMSAVMGLTLAVQAPTQAHAGKKGNALIAGLVVGAAATALILAKSHHAKAERYSEGQDENIDCGPGRTWAPGRAKCIRTSGGYGNKSGGKMLKRNGGGYISVASCMRKGMVPEFGYCVEND